MTQAETIRRSFQLMAETLKAFPDTVANAMDGWVLRMHSPVDIYDNGSIFVCRQCKNTWPCTTHVEVSDRLQARQEEA